MSPRDPVPRWLAVLSTVVGVIVGGVLIAGWVRSTDDQRYVTRVEFQQVNAKLDRILDAVCDPQRDNRRVCQESTP